MAESEFTGQCSCGHLQYKILSKPLFVHCCHCHWCQRESGSAFALNAMIETSRLQVVQGEPEMINTPTASGKGQEVARCPHCKIALWSHYAGAGKLLSFVRVGSLHDADAMPPDIHIFTESKQAWLQLPPGTPAVAQYYKSADYWPVESLARKEVLFK